MDAAYSLRLLTDDPALVDLCQKYWEIDSNGTFPHKVSDLVRASGMKRKDLERTLSSSCEAVSATVLCSTCQRPYVYLNRTDYQGLTRWPRAWVCDECKRLAAAEKEEAQRQAAEAYRQVIVARYGGVELPPIIVDDLSLDSAVFLLSFARVYAAEDFSFAHSVEPVGDDLLAPTPAMTLEVVRQLYRTALIAIHPQSPVTAFEGEGADRFFPLKVLWTLPTGAISDHPKDLIEDVENALRAVDWPEHWLSDRLELWRTIALHECLQYLQVTMKEHGFDFSPGEKTKLVISQLLYSFSVAQIWGMMWRAVKDAVAYMARTHEPRSRAANTVVGNLQRQGERAMAEGWVMKSFGRRWDCPQSKVTQVYFNLALKIGDKGITMPPGLGEEGQDSAR